MFYLFIFCLCLFIYVYVFLFNLIFIFYFYFFYCYFIWSSVLAHSLQMHWWECLRLQCICLSFSWAALSPVKSVLKVKRRSKDVSLSESLMRRLSSSHSLRPLELHRVFTAHPQSLLTNGCWADHVQFLHKIQSWIYEAVCRRFIRIRIHSTLFIFLFFFVKLIKGFLH